MLPRHRAALAPLSTVPHAALPAGPMVSDPIDHARLRGMLAPCRDMGSERRRSRRWIRRRKQCRWRKWARRWQRVARRPESGEAGKTSGKGSRGRDLEPATAKRAITTTRARATTGTAAPARPRGSFHTANGNERSPRPVVQGLVPRSNRSTWRPVDKPGRLDPIEGLVLDPWLIFIDATGQGDRLA